MATRRKFSIDQTQYEKKLKEAQEQKGFLWRLDDLEWDKAHRQLRLTFKGATFGVPLAWVPELKEASPLDLRGLRLTPSGDTVVAERLDKFISVEALMKDFMEIAIPPAALASFFGSKGGSQSSERKSIAAAANGSKGGRPRKVPEHALAADVASPRTARG